VLNVEIGESWILRRRNARIRNIRCLEMFQTESKWEM
jgi:hypothetical protein